MHCQGLLNLHVTEMIIFHFFLQMQYYIFVTHNENFRKTKKEKVKLTLTFFMAAKTITEYH